MSLLRNLTWLFVLAIAFFAVVPNVRAQSTSITNFQSPAHTLVGEVTVSFGVTYSMGSGSYLGAVIWDRDANTFATGTGTSSPDSCLSKTGTQYANAASCPIGVPKSPIGTESFTFTLRLNSPKTYDLEALAVIEDSSYTGITSSLSSQDFTILVRDKVDLTVSVQSSVVVTVDGVQKSPGIAFEAVYPGSHTVSVPSFVQVDNSTRLRFDHWEDGSTSTTRTLYMQDDTTLTANYVTQYRLSLVSSQANASGSGWYDSGTVPTFSVPSRSQVVWVFQGWYEGSNLLTKSNSGSIRMDAPLALVARWEPDYILLGGIIGVVVGLAVGVAYFGGKGLPFLTKPSGKRARRKRGKRTQTVSEPAAEAATVSEVKTTPKEIVKPSTDEKVAMFCTQCGAKIARDSKFCKECGTKIS
ncbi:MAG: zinc ribbon domain-containing protein [Candidatus Bathyarchaeia archaeon]